jgi:hypothetical protein
VQRLTTLAALLLALLVPAIAHAQAGWYLIPSLNVSEEFDDNVFSAASHRSWDLITRASPNFKAGYQSKPFTLLGTGGIDAEMFTQHSDLSGLANRKRAGFELQYVPEKPTTFAMSGSLLETETPGDLASQNGVETGRRHVRQWSVAPSLVHRFNLTTSGDAGYVYSQTMTGTTTQSSQQGRIGLSTELTHVDTGTTHYTIRTVETDGTDSTTSHTLTLGWRRKFSQTTSLSLEGGPRFTGGNIEPDITAGLAHRFETGSLSLNYARTETTLIGQSGTVETNGLSGALTMTPERSLQLVLGAGVTRTTAETAHDITAYRANASLSYRLTKWLSASIGYRFSLQDIGSAQILRNIVTIGLDATYPTRAY